MSLIVNAVISQKHAEHPAIVIGTDSRETNLRDKTFRDDIVKVCQVSEHTAASWVGNPLWYTNNHRGKIRISNILEEFRETSLDHTSLYELVSKLAGFLKSSISLEKEYRNFERRTKNQSRNEGLEARVLYPWDDGKTPVIYYYKRKGEKQVLVSWGEAKPPYLTILLAGFDNPNSDPKPRFFEISIPEMTFKEIKLPGSFKNTASKFIAKGYTDVFKWLKQSSRKNIERFLLKLSRKRNFKSRAEKIEELINGIKLSKSAHEQSGQNVTSVVAAIIELTTLLEGGNILDHILKSKVLKKTEPSGVGGPINLATITPTEGFRWLPQRIIEH